MRRDGVVAAVLGIVLFAAAGAAFVAVADAGGDPFTGAGSVAVGGRALFGAAGWCWLVAILGLLDRRRRPSATEAASAGADPGVPTVSRGRRLYAYLREAVLPLYILHQPIVVAVAYGVVGWDAPIPVKYAAIVAASLVLTVAAYDLLVRRTPVTRFLFGMRPSRSAARGPDVEVTAGPTAQVRRGVQ